jgi:hypothetical protein
LCGVDVELQIEHGHTESDDDDDEPDDPAAVRVVNVESAEPPSVPDESADCTWK